MPTYILYPSGKKLCIDEPPQDSGGESDFHVRDGRAILIIREPKAYARKLVVLRRIAPTPLGWTRPAVAFPDQLLSMNGEVKGFTSYYCRNTLSLEELFTPLRSRLFPKWNYREFVRAALNLAKVVTWLVQKDILPVDLSATNVRVCSDAWVTLIDAASFQLRTSEGAFPCNAITPDVAPPEALVSARTPRFADASHVSFSLAVLIFRCLLLGTHPFDGVLNKQLFGAFPPDICGRISMGLYPHASRSPIHRLLNLRSAPASQPLPGAIPMDTVSDAIRKTFTRTFVNGHKNPQQRTPPHEWITLLSEFERELISCRNDTRHMFYRKLRHCPWCPQAK
ncbi:MAG: hypothetical protein KF708_07970 [Pirellulales bacterium]|nr:hypothetical protein [Pirellulales bacterium]